MEEGGTEKHRREMARPEPRKEGKAKNTPRWKAIQELIKDIEMQKASNKLIQGVFCEGGKVTPPTQVAQYVRTPKAKPDKSAKVPSKRPPDTPATIAKKRLKAAGQHKESAEVVRLKTLNAEKIFDTEKLKKQLAKTEERLEAAKKRADEAEYKLKTELAAQAMNHELTVRAVRAEVQVEMLTRPTQPLSNARSRSDSPAGQYMNMYLDN